MTAASVPLDPTSVPLDPTSVPLDFTSVPLDPTSVPLDFTSVPLDAPRAGQALRPTSTTAALATASTNETA